MARRNTDTETDGQDDVAGRNAASTAEANRGQSAEGDAPAGTRLEAEHRTAADSSVSPKSTSLHRLDAEMRGDLTQDVLTANRAAMQAEVRSGEGSSEGAEKLQELHDAVSSAQAEVNEAVKRRDAARDAYDREVEAQAVRSNRPFGELVAAAHAASDKELAEQAEYRRKALAR